jgi:hypothetical protein
MSFQDPPRRQRQSRYPALAQYEDGYSSYQDTQLEHSSGNGYQDGYQGFAGLAGAPEQRAAWEAPQQQSPWDTGAQRPVRDSGSQPSLWDTGAQRSVGDSGSQRSLWDTGAQRSLRDTGAQQAPWDPPAQEAGWGAPAQQTAWDASAQQSEWATAAQQAGWELPRRASGAFQAVSDDDHGQPRHAGSGQRRRGPGLLAGAVAGFLAAAVALGVANLVAAFVRPQASPIIAVGGAFIDRTPPALKNFAVQKFGENDKTMLLLGMYVTIALIAIAIGMLAWRRMSIGVAGIGLFGLFGAFVAITRPESHVTDVIPSIIGGIAGIVTIVWLVRVGMPKSRYRARWAGGNS